MSKLHELLAVEGELGNVAKKLLVETTKTLKKDDLFKGLFKELTMFDDAQAFNNTTDRQELTTTVDENLEYIHPHLVRYWDAVLQKDATNQTAVADIVINGTIIAAQVPSTTLLGFETKLGELRKIYEGIPTLAPGVSWIPDTQERSGVFKTEHTEKSFKSEKDMQFKTASPSTKEHPAQIVSLPVTTNVGEYASTKWSGMYTPKRKAETLDRIDILRNAIKKARMRANNTDVKDVRIGQALVDFITG